MKLCSVLGAREYSLYSIKFSNPVFIYMSVGISIQSTGGFNRLKQTILTQHQRCGGERECEVEILITGPLTLKISGDQNMVDWGLGKPCS